MREQERAASSLSGWRAYVANLEPTGAGRFTCCRVGLIVDGTVSSEQERGGEGEEDAQICEPPASRVSVANLKAEPDAHARRAESWGYLPPRVRGGGVNGESGRALAQLLADLKLGRLRSLLVLERLVHTARLNWTRVPVLPGHHAEQGLS